LVELEVREIAVNLQASLEVCGTMEPRLLIAKK
jgi:hypothetical protein